MHILKRIKSVNESKVRVFFNFTFKNIKYKKNPTEEKVKDGKIADECIINWWQQQNGRCRN